MKKIRASQLSAEILRSLSAEIGAIFKKANTNILAITVDPFLLNDNNRQIKIEKDVLGAIPYAVFSMVKTAISTYHQIGSGLSENLAVSKKIIDATASKAFEESISLWPISVNTVTSEAKDEIGDSQPWPEVATKTPGSLSLVVDVVDGTTLVAKGLDGAYSICAVGHGIKSFPDLRSYAILAHKLATGCLDMISAPEEAIKHNLSIIANGRNKNISDLVVVTHSADIGRQHDTLIKTMLDLGVSVIVPDSVVIESPYVIRICSGGDIDAMIGVFGLPEIVIGSLIAKAMNKDIKFMFRITGNSGLSNRDSATLGDLLKTTDAEKEYVSSLGLSCNKIYSSDDVAGGGVFFVGTAITNDPVLGMPGIKGYDKPMEATSVLVDPTGNTWCIRVVFR